jgi:hypothetical protein
LLSFVGVAVAVPLLKALDSAVVVDDVVGRHMYNALIMVLALGFFSFVAIVVVLVVLVL